MRGPRVKRSHPHLGTTRKIRKMKTQIEKKFPTSRLPSIKFTFKFFLHLSPIIKNVSKIRKVK